MRCSRLALAAAAVAVTLAAGAGAARAERVVAVAPLATMGAEDTSAGVRKLTGQIEAAVGKLDGTRVISAARVAEAIKRARRPQLRACEGEAACLAELGKLVGAQVVISGEIGGLGEARVVYLGATDVASARELRGTTLTIGAARDEAPEGAVVRLLAPERYRGTLRFAIDVSGATVYVNGARAALSSEGELSLPVGTQAVRVTHPEYHDFVRFIDVPYGATTDVGVGMQQYPIVRRDLRGAPANTDRIIYRDPPWWRRWYVVGPAAVGLAVITRAIVAAATRESFELPVCGRTGAGACERR